MTLCFPRPICSVLFAVLLSVSAICQPGAYAQDADVFPARPITLIVPWPAGGINDLLGRLAAERMATILGQPIVTDNRGGAVGRLGSQLAAKALPNGYTICLISSGTHVIAAALDPNLPFDPINDFVPIVQIAEFPLILLAHPSLPASNLKEVIALAKARPGKLNIGSAGAGAASHLTGEMFKQRAGIYMLFLHYRGEVPVMTDLVAGRIDLTFTAFGAAQYLKQGKAKAIATTGLARWSLFPDVPTMDEQGLKGFNTGGWTGLAAIAKTSPAVVAKLADAAHRAMDNDEMRKRLIALGTNPSQRTPEQLHAMMKSDLAGWKKLIAETGLKIEQ